MQIKKRLFIFIARFKIVFLKMIKNTMENPTYNTLLNVVMNLKGIKETVFYEKDYLESILKIENEIDKLNEKCDCLRNEYLRLKAVNEIIRFANK